MSNLNKLAKKAHENAVSKGFYDVELEVGTLLMLVVSELGEAMEAHRKGFLSGRLAVCNLNAFVESECLHDDPKYFEHKFESDIKDTFEDEIADTFILLLGLCGHMNIDIDKHIELKMKYNETRPYKHGKKY